MDDLSALQWQRDAGITCAISEEMANWHEEIKPIIWKKAQKAPVLKKSLPPSIALQPEKLQPQKLVEQLDLKGINSIKALNHFVKEWADHPLYHDNQKIIFSNGSPHTDIMVIGEGPGKEEEDNNTPIATILFDHMLKSIGLQKENLYITNLLPWRPIINHRPMTAIDYESFYPLLHRHVELILPKIIVVMGGSSLKALCGSKQNILRARGTWLNFQEIPVLPMLHPAFLRRNPLMKQMAWQDLQELRAAIPRHC